MSLCCYIFFLMMRRAPGSTLFPYTTLFRSIRDVTPDATLAIADRVMPGFGEQMRQISLHFVPTAILSRQVGVIRKKCLILNLPGRPKSIKETLEGVKDSEGKIIVNGIFASVPYCLELLEGPYIETHDQIVKSFRPKSSNKSNI